MEYRKFDNHYILRLEKNEEIITKIKELCLKENITLGSITGLGASNLIEIGLFNVDTKEYKTKTYTGMFEITSLVGNISRKENEPYLHLHINFSDETNITKGGHLVKSIISATGEIVITKLEGEVQRELNPDIGLHLFKFI